MINDLLKQKQFAEKIIKNGFSNNVKKELKILAKYYKHVREFGNKEIEDELYNHCNKTKWFKKVLHYKLIDSALREAKKTNNPLIEIDSIGVTQPEVDYISNLTIDDIGERLLFTLMVINKLNKKSAEIKNQEDNGKCYYGGGEWSYKMLINALHLGNKINHQKLHLFIGKLSESGYIRVANKAKIELLFMYEIERDGEIVVEIKDFDRIGLYFALLNGEKNIKNCDCCSVPIKVSNNRMKYCEDCWREKQLLKYRKYNEKRNR